MYDFAGLGTYETGSEPICDAVCQRFHFAISLGRPPGRSPECGPDCVCPEGPVAGVQRALFSQGSGYQHEIVIHTFRLGTIRQAPSKSPARGIPSTSCS